MISAIGCSIVLACASQELPALALEQPVESEIGAADAEVTTPTLAAGYAGAPIRAKSYRLRLEAPGAVTIELRSFFFDAYLVVRDEKGEVLAEDDDGLIRRHARIVLRDGGPRRDLRVDAVALHGAVGPFRLTARAGEAAPPVGPERARLELEDSRDAVRAMEAMRGPDDPDTAAAMAGLAAFLHGRGMREEARELFERAIAITEKAVGPDDPRLADRLSDLAISLRVDARYDEARPLYERALAIQEKALGPDDARTANSVNNLAVLFQMQGELERARPLYERAIAAQEKRFGADAPQLIAGLCNLATLLQAEGEFEPARARYERALVLLEKLPKPDEASRALLMNNLASCLQALRRYEDARRLFEEALAIQERLSGPEDPDTVTMVCNIAALLEDEGKYKEARPLYERVVAIRAKVLPPDHPDVATGLNNLAGNLAALGEHAQARELFERALAISEKTLGPDHPDTAGSRDVLGHVLFEAGERDLAVRQWTQAFDSIERHVAANVWSMSADEGLAFAGQKSHFLRHLLTAGAGTEAMASDRDLHGRVLAWKGQASRGLALSRESVLASADVETRELLRQLLAAKREISRRVFADAGGPDGAADAIAKLQEEERRLERELARRSGRKGAPVPSFAELVALVPEGGALVDTIAYQPWIPPQTVDGKTRKLAGWGERQLCAFVVRGGAHGARGVNESKRVDLGPAKPIEEAVQAFLEQIESRRGAAPAAEERAGEAEATLRRTLWEPLASAIGDAAIVFVSPDSFLCRFPFETLRDGDGRFLIESRAFVYLQDFTALPRLAAESKAPPALLVAGGVDYDARDEVASKPDVAPSPEPSGAESRPRSRTSFWEPLRATRSEAAAVAQLHRLAFGDEASRTELSGAAMSEERLKAELGRSRYVHLSTHGFFEPEEEGATGDARTPALSAFRSGIVCSGANLASRKDAAPAARDDGYLTASELAWSELSGVDLVVLSACDTGLGRPEPAEGLIGLRRTLRDAGVRTVISSLWKVDDEATCELMKRFYANLWQRRLGKLEALRQAQLSMLRDRDSKLRRPAAWGAFVLDGDWR